MGVNSPKRPFNVCFMPDMPKECEVMCVGEVPGDGEDRMGAAFSDKIGKTVRAMFTDAQIDVYYTYAVKCRKAGVKDKINTRAHVRPCATNYLLPEIATVKPKHIIVFGAAAFAAVTGKGSGFSKCQGQRIWHEALNAWIYPTYNTGKLWDQGNRVACWNEIKMFIRMIQGEDIEFKPPCKIVTTLKGLRKIQRLIAESGGKAAADTETQGLDMFIDGQHVRCIQLCWDVKYGGVFIPLGLAEE